MKEAVRSYCCDLERELQFKNDVYALGVSMWELVFNAYPFQISKRLFGNQKVAKFVIELNEPMPDPEKEEFRIKQLDNREKEEKLEPQEYKKLNGKILFLGKSQPEGTTMKKLLNDEDHKDKKPLIQLMLDMILRPELFVKDDKVLFGTPTVLDQKVMEYLPELRKLNVEPFFNANKWWENPSQKIDYGNAVQLDV